MSLWPKFGATRRGLLRPLLALLVVGIGVSCLWWWRTAAQEDKASPAQPTQTPAATTKTPTWPTLAEQLERTYYGFKVKPGTELEKLIRANQDFSMLRSDEMTDKRGLPPWLRVWWRKAHPEGKYTAEDPTGGYPLVLKEILEWMMTHQDLKPGPGVASENEAEDSESDGDGTNVATIGTNVRTSGAQSAPRSESDIRVNYWDGNKILSASNNIGGTGQQGVYYSTDGGTTWAQTTLGLQSGDSFHSDPTVDWTSEGRGWSSTLGINSAGSVLKLRNYYSPDNGATWTFDATPSGTQTAVDKQMVWVDHSATSSFVNQQYAIWHNNAPVFMNRRTAGASGTWLATPIQVSGAETTGTGIGADVKTNSAGEIFGFWPDTGSRRLNVVKSTNGGTSYGSPVQVATTFDSYDIGVPAFNSRRILIYMSGGTYRTATKNNVYAAWTDLSGDSGCTAAANEPGSTVGSTCKTRIWFARSTDGGATWSAAVKINNQSGSNDQFNQWLVVDETTGQIAIIYYDTVADSGRKKTDVWYQASCDDGATWSTAQKVTTAQTDETITGANSGNQYGDYNGLSGNAGVLFPSWTDRRNNASEEIYTARLTDSCAPTPLIVGNSSTIATGSCGSPTTTAIDPGEVVTVNLPLQNNGTAPTGNLVATLQATGGVTNPSAPQSYGSLVVGGSATKPFTFTASSSCGGTLTATFNVTDGTYSTVVTQTFTVGTASGTTSVFSQNFDGVTAPALPAGWTTATTGTATAFGTTATTPDTAPNAAFVNGNTTASTSSLISPTVNVPTGGTKQLTFRQTLNFEDATTRYDGAVLEVSTDGGTTFVDVTDSTIGGTFGTNGYTAAINSNFSNPLAGRSSWGGVVAAYQTVTVNFPTTFSGANVKFRWRAGWDSSTNQGNPNWRVDTISLTTTSCVSCTAPKVWTGAVSSDWHNANNWSPTGVPGTTDVVVIPASGVTNEPNISAANVTIAGLQLASARTLTIAGGLTLTVTGQATINGVVNVNGTATLSGNNDLNSSTFNYSGATAQTLPGLNYNNLTVNDAAGVTLGGNATVSNTLTLTNGILNTGANTLNLGCSATVSGAAASRYVRGNLKKDYCANGSFTYPTGTANGYSPVTVNVTTLATNPSSLTALAVQGVHPDVGLPNNRLQRYWTLTKTGNLTANLQFNYLASDITGPGESTFNVYKIEGGIITNLGGTIDAVAHTASVTGVSSFSDWTIGDPAAPTLAKVNEYQAYNFPDGNLIRWRSELETRNLGFNVYRQEGRRRVLVTPDMVAGSALRFGADTTLTAGNSYSWWDANGRPDSVYWLEDVELNGKRTQHGPIALTRTDAANPLAQSQASALLSQMRPSSTGNGVTLRQALPTASAAPAPGSDLWQQQLNLAGRAALKLTVRQAGWYRLTGAQIPRNVIAPDAEARFLRLYLNGQEQPIVARANDGRDTGPLGDNGYIEFYGTGANLRETDSNTYWLVSDTTPGLRIGPPVRVAPGGGDVEGNGAATPNSTNGKGQAPATPDASTSAPAPGGAADSFPYTVEREENTIYFPALWNGEEAENFFGSVINNVALNQVLPVSKLASGAGTLEVALQGATQTSHRVQVQLNGQTLGTVQLSNRANKVQRFAVPVGLLTEGDNTVTLQSTGSEDVSLVDHLRLTYPHRYEAENNQLRFTASRAGLRVTGFSSNRVRVFDITEPARVLEVATTISNEAGGYAVTLSGQVARRTLYAVEEGQMLTPASLTTNTPSSWTQPTRRADFLIVTHQNFRAAVEPLAALRRSQGFETEVITVEDLYDEWNGGEKSTQAMRGFLLWARANWQLAPRYVLLVGDASYDPRNYSGLGNNDYLPTAYVQTDLLETASDESLADSNQDGIGEMAFGRLPARTLEQTQLMVNKVLSYQVPADSRGALLVSDRPEGYDFAAMSQAIRELLPPTMPVVQVNRATLTDAEARQQIIQGFNNGPALVNYNGHGSVEVWVGAGLLRSTDAALLTNSERLPVVYSMTCLNGFFQDTATDALAEALIKASGGAVAVWSSSGLTVATGQTQINRAFMRYIYQDASAPRLGDAVRAAKGATSDLEVRKTWILLGDPTLLLH